MHPEKKQILLNNHSAAFDNDFVASFDDLGVDELADILEFLTPEDIMRSRRINKTLTEAVKKTIVPPTKFLVHTLDSYNAMAVMTRAMPNLQQIRIGDLGYGCGHKYSDGEDPNEREREAVETADRISHDIGIISNFSKLKILKIEWAQLNGRYPFLFSSFPLLEKLTMSATNLLKWDLEMLAGLPLLKELDCWCNPRLTGNISSLRVIKDTIEKVKISICSNIEGNFMDLADFPHLKQLSLDNTAVTGDIRDIGENDFSSLERLGLPERVFGVRGGEFHRISDGPELVRAVYHLNKQRPTLLSLLTSWYGMLSRDSPDWYPSVFEDDEREDDDSPPFYIVFVQAGSRVGYRWLTDDGEPCEVNWLDPEPDRDSSHYEIYVEELRKMKQVDFYRGFHQPPTEEEYRRLREERGIQ